MKHKILSLLLALALIFPVLGSLYSTTDAQAAWTDTALNVTIHSRNVSGLSIYDANGNVIPNATVTPNKDFASTSARRDTTSGNVFYKIADNQYLSSQEVLPGIPNLVVNSISSIVTTKAGDTPLYDGNGVLVDGESVKGDGSWFTNKQVINIENGSTFYQISPNRYISSDYITGYYAG
ncbi:SLAP domain-containing protein [Companilactobacillus ginsenosidimutans]|uniref:S-layer protein C-terminal domain-containing protein n=1 Tax=Companilactobacillus ginsenosidimutans TaxID=1007676 RepID=A0A0H4R1P3_9LACO|nr:SLAP domain-containing protein [Companilactobacillus ginsenosidimutans]AKP67655.1 hypothetical protein ABM34_09020 [Companilactobacillus ginsenosidimutans]